MKKKEWGSCAFQLYRNILGTSVKNYLKLIRDMTVYSAWFICVRGKGRECGVTSNCNGMTQGKFFDGGEVADAIGSRYRSGVRESTRKSSASDRSAAKNIRLYTLNWRYFGTHGRVSGATARGVVSNYGRYTPTALGGCPNRAGEGLRHNIIQEANSSSLSSTSHSTYRLVYAR